MSGELPRAPSPVTRSGKVCCLCPTSHAMPVSHLERHFMPEASDYPCGSVNLHAVRAADLLLTFCKPAFLIN